MRDPSLLWPLADDEVHVWHFAHVRAQGRAPLLALLAHYTGDTPTLLAGNHGRPRLMRATGLDFNWSHSVDLAVVAVARGIAPGVDVERLRPRPRALDLAQRFFHADETTALRALPATAQVAAFLRLWTAKEAVLKASGAGISFGLDRLRIASGDTLALDWIDGDDAAAWQLHALSLDDASTAALAWRGAPRRITVRALATPRAPVQCGQSHH